MGYPAPFRFPEPAHESDAFQWFRDRLAKQDVEFFRTEDLDSDVAVSRTNRRIWVPAACGFRAAYRLGTRALLFVVGGAEWAPEFAQSYQESQGAHVIPFPRGHYL